MVIKINPGLITDDMMYECMHPVENPMVTIDFSETPEMLELIKRIHTEQLWGDILEAAKTNQVLQEALDHAVMIYNLSKEYKDGI